jgi:hypothetical protein
MLQGNMVDGFALVCTIMADLSEISGYLEKHSGPRGDYWTVNFEVGILFGSTELAAILIWKDLNVRFVQSLVPSCSSFHLVRERNAEVMRQLLPSSSPELKYMLAPVTSFLC